MSSPENPARDSLRAFAFSSEVLKPASKLVEYRGHTIEVRAPSDHVQSMAMARADIDGDKKTMNNMAAMKSFVIVHCCYVPGTDTKVFELADEKQIRNAPVGSLFSKLWSAISSLTDEEDAEGKDEPETQAGTS